MQLKDFLTGNTILETVDSEVNGELTVRRDFAWGTHIQAGGLTQSGGVAYMVWNNSLTSASRILRNADNALIIGLGGGSIAKIISRKWPLAKIIGVDIDPVIVELGKKYLGLNKLPVDIYIKDAYDFVFSLAKSKKRLMKYDLICVDVYVGDNFPVKFESEDFLNEVSKLLSDHGIVVFNRLYYGTKRQSAIKFGKKLEKIFKKVEYVYPEANLMFVCSN